MEKSKTTYEKVALEWLEYQKKIVKESTHGTYSTSLYNHLIPRLGHMPIGEINRTVMQDLVFQLLGTGRCDKSGGLSERTVKSIMTILKSTMHYAEQNNYINYQDMQVIYPKEKKSYLPKILSHAEQDKLQKYIVQNITPHSLGILFAIQTGVRIGELCALQYRDINLQEGTVNISKTLQRTFAKNTTQENTSQIIISTPKSKTSIRTIPLTKLLMGILKEYSNQPKDNYLLTGDEKYIEPRSYYNYYKKILKAAGINYLNFHGLRHTFATRCIEAGGDYKIVSELLGHSSVKITLDLYVHPQMDAKRQCVELINAR